MKYVPQREEAVERRSHFRVRVLCVVGMSVSNPCILSFRRAVLSVRNLCSVFVLSASSAFCP